MGVMDEKDTWNHDVNSEGNRMVSSEEDKS